MQLCELRSLLLTPDSSSLYFIYISIASFVDVSIVIVSLLTVCEVIMQLIYSLLFFALTC